MTAYRDHLWRAELTAIACLLLYAAALAALLALGAGALATETGSPEGVGRSFALVLWFSILPTTLVFAPIYALMRARGWASFPTAIVVGILSSAVLVALFRNAAMALYALPSGAVVAAGTHAIMRRMQGSTAVR